MTESEFNEMMGETQAEQSALSGLNSTRPNSIFKLWRGIVAKASVTLSALWDAKESDLERIVVSAPPGSALWFRQRSFDFQYGHSLALVNGIPQYATIDEDAKIITRCAVSGTNGTVTLLVAKDEPPTPLTAAELSAFQAYWTDTGSGATKGIGTAPAGMTITCSSPEADKIYIEGTVYFSAQYSAVIQTNVLQAIRDFLAQIEIDTIIYGPGSVANGVINAGELVDAVKAVEGVSNFWLRYLVKRAHGDAFGLTDDGTRSAIVSDGDWDNPPYALLTAGYAVEETEPGESWSDKLTFTAI